MEASSREGILCALQANYAECARQLDGVTEEDAGLRPDENQWSIKEALAHLLICDEFAHARLVRIVHETDPYLSGFDDHQLLQVRGYRGTAACEIRDTLLAFGQATLNLLGGLSEQQWQRTARHEERGPITIGYIAGQMLAEHHREHLEQIHDLKRWLAARQP